MTNLSVVNYEDAHSLWVLDNSFAPQFSGAASDIIFNHDWSSCRDEDGNWIVSDMHSEAKSLAMCLRDLGVDCDHLGVLHELFDRM